MRHNSQNTGDGQTAPASDGLHAGAVSGPHAAATVLDTLNCPEVAKRPMPVTAERNLPSRDNCKRADAAEAPAPVTASLALPPLPAHKDSAATVLDTLRYMHRECCFAMAQRMKLDAALGAFLRTQLGWNLYLPDKERKAIERHAAQIASGKVSSQWDGLVSDNLLACAPLVAREEGLKKRIAKTAATLSIWEYAQNIRGLGAYSLGVIVSEAGDLGSYKTRNHLWKRMGVGVVDGLRQGSPGPHAAKEDWIRHGYNRQRRSRMWVIGANLIRSNNPHYRAIYDARKEREKALCTDIRPIVAHARAQRYMEQRLLGDLRREWIRITAVAARTAPEMADQTPPPPLAA